MGKVKSPSVLIRRLDFWLQLVLFFASFALYSRTMPPSVLDGDSGEFQHMAYYLGVPHSSGYPLYILLGKLFTLLPVGDVAFRMNLFSVVCTALAIPLIYALAFRLIERRAPAFLATLFFAVIPSIWGGALETKTYALHVLLGVLTILFAVRWHQDNRPRDFYATAFVYGLGLTNHHLIVFLAPALAYVVWLNRARLNRSMFVTGILLVLLPLLLYAYIPIRANQLIANQDPQNLELYKREDAILKGQITAYFINTPQGWFNLVTGLDNYFKFGFKDTAEQTNRLANAANLLVQQFGFVGLALIGLGTVVSFRRNKKIFALLLLVAAGVGFIALYLRALSTVYYFSLCYLALALWLAFGVDWILQFVQRAHRIAPAIAAIIFLTLPISAVSANYAALDESQNYAPRDYALEILNENLPRNAVVIAPWEISEPLRYFQFVEGRRPDLLVVNVSPIWLQFDRLVQRANELKRPIYYVQFDPEFRTTPGYRSVKAVPLPMMQEPRPQIVLSDQNIVPQVQVLGYDLKPATPQPGAPLRLSIYYNARERMYPMYSSTLTVTDITGKLIGDYDSFPGSRYFPTYRWYELGNFYRDDYTIVLPADAPAGLYHLDLAWHEFDINTGVSSDDKTYRVSLGEVRVGDLAATNIAHPASQHIGDAITFLGWSGETTVARGQTLNLDLFWRAEKSIAESYTVFVHLVNAEGLFVTDADAPPSRGLYPTNRWNVGEGVRDRHSLKIPAEVAPGKYFIEIGMYLPATNTRLSVGASDKIALTQIVVK